MHWLDLTIVGAYVVAVLGVALWVRRGAAQDLDSYFLGGRKLKWWALGASGMASNVDAAGTMLITSLLLTFGLKALFIGIRGDIVLIMAFFMVYMGKWTRRSGCMTIAEWMDFRFGPQQGAAPRLIVAIYNLVFLIGVLAYSVQATTTFFEAFLDWPAILATATPAASVVRDYSLYLSVGLILFVMVYTALAGLPGVIWTDVLQGGLILFFALYIGARAFAVADPSLLTMPDDVGGSWANIAIPWRVDPPPGYDDLSPFALMIGFFMLKTVIDGMSGAGGYLSQRFFAANNERECGLLSLVWVFLMAFRWPMAIGIAVLGLSLGEQVTDPEAVLPLVLQQLVPAGIRGLLLVALIAAAMSTYSSFVNTGASYFVRDIYQAYMRPGASQRELVAASYVSTIVLVMLGVALYFSVTSINEIWTALTFGFGAGIILPNFLRWYWWRMNGHGYAAGAAAAMGIALVAYFVGVYARGATDAAAEASLTPPAWAAWWQQWGNMTTFAAFSGVALVVMIVVSRLTPAAPIQRTTEFYRVTRPFGFWKPIRAQLPAEEVAAINAENRRDIISLFFAVPWQFVLFLIPMTIVIHAWALTGVLTLLFAVLSAGLYWFWFRGLRTEATAPGEPPPGATADGA